MSIGDNAWNGKFKTMIKNFLNYRILENLYDCTKDWRICFFGALCAPCLFGSNAEKISGESRWSMCGIYLLSSLACLCWIPHSTQRTKLREKYNLVRNPEYNDASVTFCCGPCALCQEAREIKSRGKS